VANPQSYQFSLKLGDQIISTSDADDEAFFNMVSKSRVIELSFAVLLPSDDAASSMNFGRE
jgi:hypothetical protein